MFPLMKPTITKIGLFGGTFDPIHIGHLIVAETVRTRCQLDKLIFIPAKTHALKDNNRITPVQHRLSMVQLAIEPHPAFEVSDIEIQRPGVSYSIDTISHFREVYPPEKYQLHFLLGSDAVNEFHQWHEPNELLTLCEFIAFSRAGAAANPDSPYASAFTYVEIPALEISASEIRKRVKAGESIRYFVPEPVRLFVEKHQLYKI